MNRSVAGSVFLVIAALALAVLPGVLGHQVAGTATAMPIPRPLRVGDCLGSFELGLNQSTVQSADSVVDYPSATKAVCTTRIVGEVVSVDVTANTTSRIDVGNLMDSIGLCSAQASSYLGLPPVSASGPTWNLSVSYGINRVGPDPLQRAGGQTWSACVIGADPYVGSVRNAYRSGRLPDSYGQCLIGAITPETANWEDCGSPHQTQLIAQDTGGSFGTPARALATCSRLAAQAMRTADPTEAGSLRVRVDIDPESSTDLLCSLTAMGGRKLGASLFGLGSSPVPWAT